ncbi:hypothetical protein KAU32_12315 [bacterium]|nr:hypothetical protein [bacterium]
MKKTIKIFIDFNHPWDKRTGYVFEVFSDYANLDLLYVNGPKEADIACSNKIKNSLMKILCEKEIVHSRLKFLKNDQIPVLIGDSSIDYFIENSFLFLSNIQERFFTKRDQYNRFPFKESLQYKFKINYPIVEYYFDNLIDYLKNNSIISENHKNKKEILFDKNIYGTLSHDIDIARRYPSFPSDAVKYYLKKFSIKWVKEVCGYLRERYLISPDMLHRIEKVEKKQGMSSTFFVIPISTHKKDNKLNMGIIIDEIRKLSDDMEIGLHYPYETLSDPEKHLNSSISELSSASLKVSGARAHYLRTDIKVLRALEQAGIEYDSSLAFAQMSGYRNGVSFPFKMYDIEKEASMNMWQIPLTSMDQSFIGYGGGTLKEFFSNELESPPTAFSHILVHNYNILNTRRSINLYKDFLVNLKKSGKYVTLTEYLSEWKSVSG